MGELLASDDNSYITGTELFVDGGSAQVSALIADETVPTIVSDADDE